MVMLQNCQPSDSYLFFFFLGLLPGGATHSQLKDLWGKTHNECLKTLFKFKFCEQDGAKIVLKPIMQTYAEEAIDRASQDKYVFVICQFYLKTLSAIYANIDVCETQNQLTEQFESEILNIRATLERLVEKNSGLSEVYKSERSDLDSESESSLSSARLSPRNKGEKMMDFGLTTIGKTQGKSFNFFENIKDDRINSSSDQNQLQPQVTFDVVEPEETFTFKKDSDDSENDS